MHSIKLMLIDEPKLNYEEFDLSDPCMI